MPFPPEEWEQIRCANPSCGSRTKGGAGRVILERHPRSGLFRKIIGKLRGRTLMMRLIMPASVPCESCGWSWFNPLLPVYDDYVASSQAAIADAAEQHRLAVEARSNVLPVEDRFRRVVDAA